MSRRSGLASRPQIERLDARLVLSTVTPAQIQAAYGLTGITVGGTALTGTGQTIAIIDAYNDPNAATELATFDAQYGLAAAKLTVDNLGSSQTDTGWEEEEALDIETAHLAAPGANILLVEAKSDSTPDLMAAVAVANLTPGVKVVSMSWGGSDTASETGYDNYFTYSGITYLAASGDDGEGAEWPADSPDVIAVGGTSLVATTSGRVSETAWSDSGGGISSVETEPGYQTKAQSTGYKTTPDVSADADPDTGLEIYSIANGGWNQVGGTSLATPIWAGLIAEADQGRALYGKAALSSLEALYDLYNAPTGSFDDITSGSRATSSYDISTGLGTPNGATLIASLIADPSTTANTSGNGVGGDPLPTTTITTTPTPPSRGYGPPFGGGFGGRGFFTSQAGYSADGGWAAPYLPRNAGQGSTASFTPITVIRSTPSAITIAPAEPAAPTPEAVDAALEDLNPARRD